MDEPHDHRQLLAIMFTDVVGYTALAATDAESVPPLPRRRRVLAALIPNARFEVVEGGQIAGTGGTPEVRARILEFFDEEPARPAAAAPSAAGHPTHGSSA